MGEKVVSRKTSKHKKTCSQRSSMMSENGTCAPNGIALRALTANVPKHKLIRDAEPEDNAAMAFDPAAHLFDKKRTQE